MLKTLKSFNGINSWLVLVFASILISPVILSNQAAASPQIFLNDNFDTDLSGWQYFGYPGYNLTFDTANGSPEPSAHISGDAFHATCSEHGMYKVVDLSSYSGDVLGLSFHWRATSSYADAATTISEVKINNADTGVELFKYRLVNGGTTDTGWQYFSEDISSYVAGVSRIQINLYLYDCWDLNWNENNWYDDVLLVEGQSAITVNSQDVLGNELTGIWVALLDTNGDVVDEGYTPITFDAFMVQQYTVYANNYLQHVFLHWEDGSTDASRDIIPTEEEITLTATYTITTADKID